MLVDSAVRGQQWLKFFTEGSIIMDCGLKLTFQVKNAFLQTCRFSLRKTLIDGLESCGLLVDYCDVFISSLDSHSDGTHSLQRFHWWTSDVMLTFSKSVQMKKQTHLHLGWPEGEYIFSKFSFLSDYSFVVAVLNYFCVCVCVCVCVFSIKK